MEKKETEEGKVRDVFSGKKQAPVGTSVGGTAAAVVGGGIGAPAGPVGVAVGAAIGAVLGVGFERKAEHQANPEIVSGTMGEPAGPAKYHEQVKNLSPAKQQALLDLAVLAIFADGMAAITEETAFRRLLKSIDHNQDWKTIEDSVVARNRPFLNNSDQAGQRAESLARTFDTDEEKKLARHVLDDVLASGPGGSDARNVKSSFKKGLRD